MTFITEHIFSLADDEGGLHLELGNSPCHSLSITSDMGITSGMGSSQLSNDTTTISSPQNVDMPFP
jgi:hypothetical protein